MVGTATTVEQDNGSRAALDATAGAVAGAIARLVVNPLDVLKIRFQVQIEPISAAKASSSAASVLSKYTGLRQAFVTIIKEEGIKVACLFLCVPDNVQREGSVCTMTPAPDTFSTAGSIRFDHRGIEHRACPQQADRCCGTVSGAI